MYASPLFHFAADSVVDEAFVIAWNYVRNAPENNDELVAQAFLASQILRMYERGERRKIALANRAIAAYERSSDPEADAACALGI
jgi:hypothetical protein